MITVVIYFRKSSGSSMVSDQNTVVLLYILTTKNITLTLHVQKYGNKQALFVGHTLIHLEIVFIVCVLIQFSYMLTVLVCHNS